MTPARRALGEELRRIRLEALGLTGPRAAEWLGVSTMDDRGRRTSTGKSLVSRYESGRRLPEREVVEQYARAPGVDRDALLALWVDAGAAAPDEEPADPGLERAEAQAEAADADAEPTDADAEPADTDAAGRRRTLVAVGLVAASVAVALVVGWTTLRPAAAPTASMTAPVPGATLVFDALGARSDQTIRIYHGPGLSEADRAVDGTYEDGQRAAIICLTHGRRVTSDPAAQESPRSSDEWARIVASDGRISYATMTYAVVSPTTARVPSCESSS